MFVMISFSYTFDDIDSIELDSCPPRSFVGGGFIVVSRAGVIEYQIALYEDGCVEHIGAIGGIWEEKTCYPFPI